jgi:hypothetical protein
MPPNESAGFRDPLFAKLIAEADLRPDYIIPSPFDERVAH